MNEMEETTVEATQPELKKKHRGRPKGAKNKVKRATAVPAPSVPVEAVSPEKKRQDELDAIARRVQEQQIKALKSRPTAPEGIVVGNTWDNTDDVKVRHYLDGSDPDHPLAYERLLPDAPKDWRKLSRKGGRQGYEQPTANARWVSPKEYADGLFAHRGIRLVRDKDTGELVRGNHGDYLAWEPIEAKRARLQVAGNRSEEWVEESNRKAGSMEAVMDAANDPNLPKFDGEHGAELIPHENTRSPAYQWKE